jgi:RNA polymerase sigma-70 factor (ECF subfamily)
MSESVIAHAASGHGNPGEVAPCAPTVAEPRLVALVREHYAFVWRVLRRFGLAPSDADDAAQQVFMVLSQRAEDVVLSKERAFLFRTATYVAAKAHRARKRRPETPAGDWEESEDSAPQADELVDRRRARELLDRVLSEMPHDLKAVIVLFELEGLTMSEIADALEVPPGTVASRLRRARVDLAARVTRARTERSAGATKP